VFKRVAVTPFDFCDISFLPQTLQLCARPSSAFFLSAGQVVEFYHSSKSLTSCLFFAFEFLRDEICHSISVDENTCSWGGIALEKIEKQRNKRIIYALRSLYCSPLYRADAFVGLFGDFQQLGGYCRHRHMR
jgi:hypothetical protein